MKITVEKLKGLSACNSGIEYFGSKHSDGVELTDLIREDIETRDWRILEYANWLIVHCMTYKQLTDYALCMAELILPECEKEYPYDCRLRIYTQMIRDFKDEKFTREQLLVAAHVVLYYSDFFKAIMIKILQYGVTLLEVKNE